MIRAVFGLKRTCQLRKFTSKAPMAFDPYFVPVDYKRSDDLCRVTFRQPGFNGADYGRDKNVTVKSLMMVTTAAEAITLGNDVERSFLGHPWFGDKDMTTFSLNYELEASKALHNPDFYKSELRSEVSMVRMGKSSLTLLARFFISENPTEPVLSYVHNMVRVSFKTRKPVAWPAWMAEAVKGSQAVSPSSDQVVTPARIEKFTRPANTFIYNVHVMWSDTDENAHCNFGSYAKYATDAIRAALRFRDVQKEKGDSATNDNNNHCYQPTTTAPTPGKDSSGSNAFVLYQGDPSLALKGIRQEHLDWGVKRFKASYFQECTEDDLLHAHIWQDGVKDNVVLVSLEKNNEVVTQIVLEYFTSSSKL